MKYTYLLLLLFFSGFTQDGVAQTYESDMTIISEPNVAEPVTMHAGISGRPFDISIANRTGTTGTIFVSSGMILGNLYPPELIMRNQDVLNLTPKQVETIKEEMRSFQSGIVNIQWDLNAAQSKLDKGFGDEKIDLDRTLKLVDDVMKAENNMKKSHMTMLIKIHNILDAAQLAELEKLTQHYNRFGMMAAPVRSIMN